MAKVTVDGQGKAKGAPDIAVIQVQVQNEHKDQKTCRLESNLASDIVVAVLKEATEENDIYVTPAQIRPRYKNSAKIIGYQGFNSITARIRNLDDAQDLLTQINNLDVEKVQVSSFQFDIDDKKELEDEARRMAFAHAKAKAETYSEEIGYPVSGVISIEENLQYGNRGRHPTGKFALASRSLEGVGEDFHMPVREALEMGDIEVTINVDVCFKVGDDTFAP